MRYSIELKDQICVKDYGFLSFSKNMNHKYSQKLLDIAKKSAANAIKLLQKRNLENSRSNR